MIKREQPKIEFFTNPTAEPLMELCQNGDIYIRGKLIENDKDVVQGMRELLAGTRVLEEDSDAQLEAVSGLDAEEVQSVESEAIEKAGSMGVLADSEAHTWHGIQVTLEPVCCNCDHGAIHQDALGHWLHSGPGRAVRDANHQATPSLWVGCEDVVAQNIMGLLYDCDKDTHLRHLWRTCPAKYAQWLDDDGFWLNRDIEISDVMPLSRLRLMLVPCEWEKCKEEDCPRCHGTGWRLPEGRK